DMGDVHQATEVMGRLARRLAVPAPAGLPRLADRADEWERMLRADTETLAHPLSERAVGAALATIRDLARTQPETMVHGDFHFGNVVRAQREEWLAIDPKGLAGDLASDSLRVLVRGVDSLLAADNLEAELLRRLTIFADAAEIERERAIRWAQVDSMIGAYQARKANDADWIIETHDQVTELLARHL
ncbi:MAG: aminoglycoside phosphotransferase family protein, partial [bacterium]